MTGSKELLSLQVVEENPQYPVMILHLRRAFQVINGILGRRYDQIYQNPLDVRFRTSVGRIVAIGNLEEVSGDNSKPRYTSWHYGWHERRKIATNRGYEIKTFEEYLDIQRNSYLRRRAKRNLSPNANLTEE